MSREPKAIPRFSSEEEELRFWDEHDPSEYFTEAVDDLVVRLKRRPKRAVTVRLDEELLAELKSTANEHGIPYQRLMRELLRESLRALKATGRPRTRHGTSA